MRASAPIIRRFEIARDGARAFTMIEMIVVVVIIGILASAIVPRMLNVGQREAELEAKAVQRLLSIAGEKAGVWNLPVALDFLGDKSTLCLWTQTEDSKTASDATGAARVSWKIDPLVEPVVLYRLKIARAASGGEELSSGKWRVAFSPGQPRLAMVIELEPKSERDGPRWTITLPTGETAATRSTNADPARPAGPGVLGVQTRSIDLDDAGKGQTKW
jgi:prepilin-type N-terminal cleavage/methylation domain-containing protein